MKKWKNIDDSKLIHYRLSQISAAHVISDTLFKPSTLETVSRLLNEKVVYFVSNYPLYKNTIARLITDMARGVKEKLSSRLKRSKFGL